MRHLSFCHDLDTSPGSEYILSVPGYGFAVTHTFYAYMWLCGAARSVLSYVSIRDINAYYMHLSPGQTQQRCLTAVGRRGH